MQGFVSLCSMNVSIKKCIYAGSFLLLLASCHDLKKQKQLDQVTAIADQVNDIHETLSQTDTTELNRLMNDVSEVNHAIKQSYSEDTISIAFAQKLEEYKSIFSGLGSVKTVSKKLDESLRQEKEALTNLKSDIQKGTGDRSKYDEYIQFEKNKVAELDVLYKYCVTTQTKCVDSYQQLHDEIRTFSENLPKTGV